MHKIVAVITYDIMVQQRGKWVVISSSESICISVVFPHVSLFFFFSTIYYFMTKTIARVTITKERILVRDCVIPYWWESLHDSVLMRKIFLLWNILLFLLDVFNLDRHLEYINITLGPFFTWLFWSGWGFFISNFFLFTITKISFVK